MKTRTVQPVATGIPAEGLWWVAMRLLR